MLIIARVVLLAGAQGPSTRPSPVRPGVTRDSPSKWPPTCELSPGRWLLHTTSPAAPGGQGPDAAFSVPRTGLPSLPSPSPWRCSLPRRMSQKVGCALGGEVSVPCRMSRSRLPGFSVGVKWVRLAISSGRTRQGSGSNRGVLRGSHPLTEHMAGDPALRWVLLEPGDQ